MWFNYKILSINGYQNSYYESLYKMPKLDITEDEFDNKDNCLGLKTVFRLGACTKYNFFYLLLQFIPKNIAYKKPLSKNY